MFQKITNFIIRKLGELRGKTKYLHVIFFFAILAPIFLISAYDLKFHYDNVTDITMGRRASIAYLAAETIEEKIDHIVDLGRSFATRVTVQRLVKEGKWAEAIKFLDNVPNDFPSIALVSLVDPKGVVMETLSRDRSVIGGDFSFRDWYKGVSKDWQPYVSEVFRAAVAPYYNSVVAAIPIKDEAGQVAGILVLQVTTETLLGWVKNIDVGPGGFVYITDQHGKIIAHPKYDLRGEIIDFSEVPVIKKARFGQSGVEITYNQVENEERVSAYIPVSKYGWVVVAQQPSALAFAERDQIIFRSAVIYLIFILIGFFISVLIVRVIANLSYYRQKEKAMLEGIGDGIVAIDRGWNVVMWNKAAEAITGWREEEIIGRPFREFIKFIREQDRTENVAFIEEAMLFGRVGFMSNNTILIRKDGSEIPVGDSAAPIFNEKGDVSGAIIVFRDISKEKEGRMLKSDFSYASHQLNTPVTKALWNLESALDENDLVKIKEKLIIAYTSAKSIQKLNSQLYIISEIDQKIVFPKLENVKLVDLVTEVLKVSESRCRECGIGINIEPISPVLGIKTDANLLKKAFIEIIENSLIYNKPGGRINLKTVIEDKGIIFEISDTGIGIPEEQKTLIFTKFFRGNNYDTTEIIGAGLGLFIAQSYVKLLNGKIWFESEKGKTTFFISLPL